MIENTKKIARLKEDEKRGAKNVIEVLQTGSISKLSSNGYHFLLSLPDFIAHYDQEKFMQYYADIRDLLADLEYAVPERLEVAKHHNDKETQNLLSELDSFIKKTDFTKQIQAAKEQKIHNLEVQITALQREIEREKSNMWISKRRKRLEQSVREEYAYQHQEALWALREAEKKRRKMLKEQRLKA